LSRFRAPKLTENRDGLPGLQIPLRREELPRPNRLGDLSNFVIGVEVCCAVFTSAKNEYLVEKVAECETKCRPYIEPVKASKGTWAFRLRW